MNRTPTFSAFMGFEHIASGSLETVVSRIKERFEGPEQSVLVFDDQTGRQFDVDLRGSVDDMLRRVRADRERPRRGRPKLGVECGELCLLPRHWEWLAAQPRSASATVRRLIEAARKAEAPEEDRRQRVDAIGSFMWTMAGDLPGFEEASRALYRGDWDGLRHRIAEWPHDVRQYVESSLNEVES
jgi:hypothetical protein